MHPIGSFGGLSHRNAPPDRRSAERRKPPELAAYLWNGSLQQQANIKDISSSGVYLLTKARFSPGDIISLTLQRRGPLEGNFERRVAIQARAVRWCEDGVALSFVFPPGMDLRLWQSPLKNTADQTEPEDILREFRMAGALAFLSRLCPGSADEVKRLLREGLSNYRVASAIEIALKAERLLAFSQNADKMKAPANLIFRVLEDGSWDSTETTQQLWSGLLATSCTLSGRDDSNLAFISLLSQLTASHIRILTAACTKGSKFISSMERLSSRPIKFSAQEMVQVASTRDLVRIQRDLDYLVDLGLLTTSIKSGSFSPLEGIELAATSLGLQLFARCHGHRGATEDFYGIPNAPISEIGNEINDKVG